MEKERKKKKEEINTVINTVINLGGRVLKSSRPDKKINK